jgi:Flp pilus assembly protein TadG
VLERRDDRGAALVEFALIAPIFFMLVLAMFTGGISYDRKLSVTSATREAVRFAATLPRSGLTANQWLDEVATVAVVSAEGNLDDTVSGRELCVAYISGTGTIERRQQIGAGAASYSTGTPCVTDGRPATEARVQVVAQRTSTLEAIFFSQSLRLRGQAVARYEVRS